MSAIGPGDWVECVDASPCRVTKADLALVKGAIYTVERLCACSPGDPGLILRGYKHERGFFTFCLAMPRFRPVRRPSESLFHDLMQPIPADLVEA